MIDVLMAKGESRLFNGKAPNLVTSIYRHFKNTTNEAIEIGALYPFSILGFRKFDIFRLMFRH